jgi:hypothetical protein
VAVAEYDVVAVGESVTLPVALEVVVTVRDDDPAVAEIVTEVAFALCQFSVTLCPELIARGLAARVTVGLAGGGVPPCVGVGVEVAELPSPVHPARKMIDSTRSVQSKKRTIARKDIATSKTDFYRRFTVKPQKP